MSTYRRKTTFSTDTVFILSNRSKNVWENIDRISLDAQARYLTGAFYFQRVFDSSLSSRSVDRTSDHNRITVSVLAKRNTNNNNTLGTVF